MDEMTLGPVGGMGGDAIAQVRVPTDATLHTIQIWADQFVHAIELSYTDASGATHRSPRIGAAGGSAQQFVLEPGEHLIGVSGLCDWFVDAIQFHTTRRVSPLFGGDGTSNPYTLLAPEGHTLSGFAGRSGLYLDALAVFAAPMPVTPQTLAAPPRAIPATRRKSGGNDLEKVEGIGPKIAALLIEAGIPDLEALAETPVARIREVLAAAGRRYAIADPTTWPAQAAYGAAGDWDGMTAYQQRLSGGRER